MDRASDGGNGLSIRAAAATAIQRVLIDPHVLDAEADLRSAKDAATKAAAREVIDILGRLTKVVQRIIEKETA